MTENDELAIRVCQLGKAYSRKKSKRPKSSMLQDDLIRLIKRLFDRSASPQESEKFWALKNASFDVKHGEVFGLIGPNGAGKSTLLKLLSRITEPTSGWAKVYGRIGALLEVKTGFHPELTGAENIYLNGALLGMKRPEISDKFDAIVDFAGVEDFLTTPVKHYSSGMKVRLGFAVAAHLEPEILLIDEVLAVGDADFRQKCLGKMGEITTGGRTILFVSHNMGAIENLCDRVAYIDNGEIQFIGPPREAIELYLARSGWSHADLHNDDTRKGSGKLRVRGIEFRAKDDQPLRSAPSGSQLTIVLHFNRSKPVRADRIDVELSCKTTYNVPVFSISNSITGDRFTEIPETGAFSLTIPKLPLTPGTYRLGFSIRNSGGLIDAIDEATELRVKRGDFYQTAKLPSAKESVCLIEGSWGVSNAK